MWGRVWQELQGLISGLVGAQVSEDQPLMEAGLDSIGSVELRNAVSAKFGVELPATVTFDHPSAGALAQFVAQHMTGGSAAAASQAGAPLQQAQLQRQSESIDEAIAQQIVATVSELLGFDVPSDQVSKCATTSTSSIQPFIFPSWHTAMQVMRLHDHRDGV
jgi:acyl carrier protein